MATGFEMMRKFKKQGWKLVRHGKKHDLFIHPDYPMEVAIPRHAKELKSGLEKGLLRILSQTGKGKGEKKR